MEDLLKISIITVVFNRKRFLREAIESVLLQDYPNIEYIVIDGGSTDGTKELIEEYLDRLAYFISEPDKNMYDAINKGMRIATGDYIGILNSDDYLRDSSVISSLVDEIRGLKEEQIIGVYGNYEKVTATGGFRGGISRGLQMSYNSLVLSRGFSFVCHGTVFLKRSVIDCVGFYDCDHFRYSCDADYITSCFKAGKMVHLSTVLFCFRIHPESITSSGALRLEVEAISRKHNYYKHSFIKRKLYQWAYWGWWSLKNIHLIWSALCRRVV